MSAPGTLLATRVAIFIQEEYDRALQHLRHYFKNVAPNDYEPQSHFLLAIVYHRLNLPHAAQATTLSLPAGHRMRFLLEALHHAHNENHGEAITCFGEWSANDRVRNIDLEFFVEDYVKSLIAMDRFEEAGRVIDQLVQIAPFSCRAYSARSLLFESLGRLDLALISARLAIRAASLGNLSFASLPLLRRITLRMKKMNSDVAIEDEDTATRLCFGEFHALWIEAIRRGNFNVAKAVEGDLMIAEGVYLLGLLCTHRIQVRLGLGRSQIGDPEEFGANFAMANRVFARVQWETSSNEFQSNALLMQWALRFLDDNSPAITPSAFQQLAEMVETTVASSRISSLFHSLAAKHFTRHPNYDRVRFHANRAIELNPNCLAAYISRIKILCELANGFSIRSMLQLVKGVITPLKKVHPADMVDLTYLGRYTPPHRSDHVAVIVERYEEVVRLFPRIAELRMKFAIYLIQNGRLKEAKDQLLTAFEDSKSDDIQQQALQWIRRCIASTSKALKALR